MCFHLAGAPSLTDPPCPEVMWKKGGIQRDLFSEVEVDFLHPGKLLVGGFNPFEKY